MSNNLEEPAPHIGFKREINLGAGIVQNFNMSFPDETCEIYDEYGDDNCTFAYGEDVRAEIGTKILLNNETTKEFEVGLKLSIGRFDFIEVAQNCDVCGGVCEIDIPDFITRLIPVSDPIIIQL